MPDLPPRPSRNEPPDRPAPSRPSPDADSTDADSTGEHSPGMHDAGEHSPVTHDTGEHSPGQQRVSGRNPGAGAWWWWRARLRAAPGGLLAFAVLVLVTAFVATALPRAVGSSADDALRSALSDAPSGDRMVSGTAPAGPDSGSPGAVRARIRPDSVRTADDALRKALRPVLRLEDGEAAYGVHNVEPAETDDPRLPAPSPETQPKATLTAQADLDDRTRLTAGRRPGAGVTGPDGRRRVEAAVTVGTARTMRLAPGDTFHLPSGYGRLTVEVTGVVAPRGSRAQVRDSAFWHAEDSMVRPTLVTDPASGGGAAKRHWHFTAFLHPRAASALLEVRQGAELFWHYPVALDGLGAARAPQVRKHVTWLSVGPGAARLQERAGAGRITFGTGFAEQLAAFEDERSAVSPLLLIAGLGLATTAGAVLLLAGALTAERRQEEFALLRSRGSSLAGLAGRVLAETATAAVPGAALGCGLALLVAPGGRALPSLLTAGGVAVLAALVLPVRAALGQRRVRVAAARTDLVRARPARRRTVLEAALFTLVVGAVLAVRQRGTGDTDALLAMAPVLLALAAAMLLLRCYPLPLRLLVRAVARRPGPVAFLGLARAGRSASAAVSGPALVALLVALTAASFGGTVLASVAEGRDAAALRAVGADARIEAPPGAQLSGSLRARAGKVEGVDAVAAFRATDEGELTGFDSTITVVLADPVPYARMAERTGQGPFAPDALEVSRAKAPSVALPVLASPGIARGLGNGDETAELTLPGMDLSVQPTLTRGTTPGAQDGAFLVLSRESVARARPDLRGTALLAPNTLLMSGPSADAAALRKLVAGDGSQGGSGIGGEGGSGSEGDGGSEGGGGSVLSLRSDARAHFSDSVLQSGAERLYAAAVLAAAGFSVLAVLLSLLQTAPERLALLARLRALGFRRGQGQGVLLLETLPLYVLTAVAGVLTGLATVPLLGPGIDLTALAGTPDSAPVRLRAVPASLVLPPLALLAVVTAGLLLQARAAARGPLDSRRENP